MWDILAHPEKSDGYTNDHHVDIIDTGKNDLYRNFGTSWSKWKAKQPKQPIRAYRQASMILSEYSVDNHWYNSIYGGGPVYEKSTKEAM